jgi:hypothetical protein
VCHYCYKRKFTDIGRSVFHTTSSISAASRHLAEEKPGHNIVAPGKTPKAQQPGVYGLLMAGKLCVLQAVANKLSSFNIQLFRQAAVKWLIANNHPLSEFEQPVFQKLIGLANPLAKDTSWQSHNSVSQYVMRYFDYLRPIVVKELLRARSKIHLSLDMMYLECSRNQQSVYKASLPSCSDSSSLNSSWLTLAFLLSSAWPLT